MKEEYLYMGVGILVVVVVGASFLFTRNEEPTNPVFVEDGQQEEMDQESLDGLVVEVYFGNETKDSAFRCTRVFGVERNIAEPELYEKTLEELFNGPDGPEKEQGYFTSVPDEVRVVRTILENGIMKITLNDVFNSIAGSCRVQAVRSQIEQTLLQFKGVDEVVIETENTTTEETLQP